MLTVQRGKHSKRHSFSGAAIGLGLGLLQRYDLHLENKKCTCLRFSYLHLCYATYKGVRYSFNGLVNPLPAPTSSHF